MSICNHVYVELNITLWTILDSFPYFIGERECFRFLKPQFSPISLAFISLNSCGMGEELGRSGGVG